LLFFDIQAPQERLKMNNTISSAQRNLPNNQNEQPFNEQPFIAFGAPQKNAAFDRAKAQQQLQKRINNIHRTYVKLNFFDTFLGNGMDGFLSCSFM
jgi:hypothetical protein